MENVVETTATMIKKRTWFSAISIHDKIFVMGGRGSDHLETTSCEVYDSKTNQFSLIAPMETPRLDFGIAINGGEIICSGRDCVKKEDSKCTEIYNIIDDTWRRGGRVEHEFSHQYLSWGSYCATIFH